MILKMKIFQFVALIYYVSTVVHTTMSMHTPTTPTPLGYTVSWVYIPNKQYP